MLFMRKTTALPSAAEALPGRATPIPTATTHFVNGRKLQPPYPAGLERAVFALGWTPCLGPTLTGVIAVASATEGSNVGRGVLLVIAYCLGLGIPFVLLAFGSARAVQGLSWLRRHTRQIQIGGGVLLILVGTALVTGVWNDFVSWVRDALVSDVRLPI